MTNRTENIVFISYLFVWALILTLAIYNEWRLLPFIAIPLMTMCGGLCFYNLHLMDVEKELEDKKREQEQDEFRKSLYDL